MRRKIYRAAAAATVIACTAMALLSWYAVGIIERSNMETALTEIADRTAETLDSRKSVYDEYAEQFLSGYRSKARSLAMLLSKEPELMEDESKLEMLRAMTEADVISIADSSLRIEYTTGSSDGHPRILERFRGAVSSSVFSEAVADSSDGRNRIVAGCSRLDKSGVVQLEFEADDVKALLSAYDVSGSASDVPIMKTGCLAVYDPGTMTYISHTDKEMIGKPVLFYSSDMEAGMEDGGFTECSISGEDVLMRYKKSSAGVVVGYVPLSEVYETRNDIIIWVLSAAVVIAVVIILAVRNRMLKINKKKRRNL